MILRTTKAQHVGVRWASRIALAVGILACGGSSEDAVFGSRDSALEEGAAVDASNAPQANTSSGVLGVATEDGPDEEAGSTGNDSGAASGSCVVSDGDDSDGDDSDGDDDDGVESDGDDVDDGVDSDGDDDVEEVEDGVDSDGDDDADGDVDSDGDDVDSNGDDDSDGDDSDGDDSDGDDSDGDDSDGDDCVPAPVAPEAAPVEIQ